MKISIRIFFVFFFLIQYQFNLNAQNVGIGITTPHSSAALEIQDTSKGILIPRMTMVQRTSIQNPAEGLMVYQTDSLFGFWYWGRGQWRNIYNSIEIDTLLSNQSKGVKIGFSESRYWICPSNIFKICVELWGAGGGGSGGNYCPNQPDNSRGGNGGNGGYIKSFINVTPGHLYQINIGNGGIGGTTPPCCGIF